MWVANATPLLPIYVFKSSWILVGDDADNHSSNSVAPEEDEEEWPPFRKVGNFDPYSDDPRLAIKKVILCPRTGTMIVAGTAGHVIISKFNDQSSSNEIKVNITKFYKHYNFNLTLIICNLGCTNECCW